MKTISDFVGVTLGTSIQCKKCPQRIDKSDKEIVVTLDFKIYFFLTLIVCLCIKKYFLHELLVKLLHIDDKSS